MLALLAVGGAIVAFVAGWAVARLDRDVPVTRHPVPEPALPADHLDVLDRQPTGVVISRRPGVVSYRNPAATAWGGTHVGILIDGAIDRHLQTALAGTTSDETLDLFGPPRRVVHVEAHPLAHGGAVAFVTDITERKALDQIRRDFVANVSHELRTPVGAMSVLAETLEGTDDPEIVARLVGRMQGEAARASRTIDDLLELSRVESAVDRDFEPVPLGDVARAAIARVAELAAQRDIAVSMLDPVDSTGPRSTQLLVSGDRPHLVSAVGNLVENAVKYSDDGSVVQVRVSQHGDHGEIAVADTGPGIPRHDLDRVFERFYRVDRARSRATGGTGLGLSIVRHVAQLHGGSVDVASVEGEGSTFVLRLPLLIADAEQSGEPDVRGGTGVA